MQGVGIAPLDGVASGPPALGISLDGNPKPVIQRDEDPPNPPTESVGGPLADKPSPSTSKPPK